MSAISHDHPVLQIQHLEKRFDVRGGGFFGAKRFVRAVDDVSFDVAHGETFGLVGESGSGKSTLGNCVLRLLEPNGGNIWFNGQNITRIQGDALRSARRCLSVVFQDPQSSLDPRMTIKNILAAPLVVNRLAKGRELEERVAAQLAEVGLSPDQMSRYPHEFSGGQRQRIGIARALITNPDFIVLDEPTSALDVSVQAQILNMLQELQTQRRVAYLFISHDLTVVRHVSRRIGVMYCGALMETAVTQDLFKDPKHPYTRALLASVPRPNPETIQELDSLGGDTPSPMDLPTGCRFHPRCPECMDVCRQQTPPTTTTGNGHSVTCHLYT
ncbi:MAG: ABC transporter ATP-binding protein [Okeania sp. SIO3B3]|nr:ABC transporter ATP-binding protein [Okeania sp. SIO3B3]